MFVSLQNVENLKTTEIIGIRLKTLIKNAIKKGKYTNQQDFFDCVQKRLDESNNSESSRVSINNQNTYSKYLNGSINMKLDVLKQICIELDCSANFLMGITPINSDYSGSILKLLTSIDSGITYAWDETEPNIIHIDYYGTILSYDETVLANKLKNLISALLFIDSKEVNK